MSLAPYATRGYEEEAGNTDTEEEIAGQKSNVGEVQFEPHGQRQSVGGEDRAEGGCEDGAHRKDEGDQITAP